MHSGSVGNVPYAGGFIWGTRIKGYFILYFLIYFVRRSLVLSILD